MWSHKEERKHEFLVSGGGGLRRVGEKNNKWRISQLDLRKTLTKASKLQAAKSAVESEWAQVWHLTESPTGTVSLMLAPDPAHCGVQLAVTVHIIPLRPVATMPAQRDYALHQKICKPLKHWGFAAVAIMLFCHQGNFARAPTMPVV